jgi:RNA polymerase sigma factor (sigma-70 family)
MRSPNPKSESRPPSDAVLMRAVQTRPAAFSEIYDRYSRQVYSFHLRRTGRADVAHDLTAETFARAWIGRSRYRDHRGGSVGPWLFGIARHVLLASIEKQRLETSACERLGLFARLEREPSRELPDQSWSVDLERAFDWLPIRQRQAVRMRVLDEMEYGDIAVQIGCTPLAARIRVSRGLAALRGRLTPTGLEITS